MIRLGIFLQIGFLIPSIAVACLIVLLGAARAEVLGLLTIHRPVAKSGKRPHCTCDACF